MQGDDFPSIQKEIQRLSAEVALLKAQSIRGPRTSSPWKELKDAAALLNYKSPRALRARIKKGQFPPDCVRVDPSASGIHARYLIHVERYINLLR